jgi:hypothetical protein
MFDEEHSGNEVAPKLPQKFLTIKALCDLFGVSRWMIRRLEEHPVVPLRLTSFGATKRIAEEDAAVWWDRWQKYTAKGGTLDGKPVEGFGEG